jgi:hypothetical protein
MASQSDQDPRTIVVISDGTGKVGCVVSETPGVGSGLCKYFRITPAGWKVLEEWSETPHRSYKAKVQ